MLFSGQLGDCLRCCPTHFLYCELPAGCHLLPFVSFCSFHHSTGSFLPISMSQFPFWKHCVLIFMSGENRKLFQVNLQILQQPFLSRTRCTWRQFPELSISEALYYFLVSIYFSAGHYILLKCREDTESFLNMKFICTQYLFIKSTCSLRWHLKLIAQYTHYESSSFAGSLPLPLLLLLMVVSLTTTTATTKNSTK